MYTCVVNMPIHVRTRDPGDRLFKNCSPLYLLRHGLSGNPKGTSSTSLIRQSAQGVPCLHLCVKATDRPSCHATWLLFGVWASKLRPSSLHVQHFNPPIHLSRLTGHFYIRSISWGHSFPHSNAMSLMLVDPTH